MNLVNLFNDAWKARSDNTHEQAEVMFKNLLSHGFVDMERVLRANIKGYDEDLFYMVQKLLACIVMADGDSFVGETDAYEKYCRWAGFQPLTPSFSICSLIFFIILFDKITKNVKMFLEK